MNPAKLEAQNLRGRELALAIGPGIFINSAFNKVKFFMECHALFDVKVRNRPEGNNYQIRLGILF